MSCSRYQHNLPNLNGDRAAHQRPRVNTHGEFCRTIHRQRLLGRVRRRARRNHCTPAPPLPPHIAHRQLDHVQHPAIIDLDDVVLGLEQLAGFIESIFKVVLLLGHARISNGDVDAAGLLECGFQILPACCVAFDEGGAWRGAFFRRRVEVEDECFGAFGGEDLDGRKADARGAACEARQQILSVRMGDLDGYPSRAQLFPSGAGCPLL